MLMNTEGSQGISSDSDEIIRGPKGRCAIRRVLALLYAKSACGSRRFEAESEGFEPPEPFSSTVFKTAAIDHSANSPSPKGLQR